MRYRNICRRMLLSNPDELVNSDFKRAVDQKFAPSSDAELEHSVHSHLKNTASQI